METLQRTSNRGSISTGFDIDNSLKLEEDNTEYLHYTPSSQTDYERLTFSLWIKRTELGHTTKLAEFGNGSANTNNLRIGFDDNNKLYIYGNSIVWRQTKQVFTDTTAWYHLFFKFDTTTPGGVSNNRIRVWVNGNMIAHTDYDTVNNPGSGTAMGFNTTLPQSIGTQQEGGVNASTNFNGYIAQVWYSGGTPPDVTDFGEFDSDSGIWKPIDISEVSIPDANGFFLDFSDSSDLGNDSSSNNNDFTLVNITAADQTIDVPTNNFCVGNTLVNLQPGGQTLTQGAAKFANPSGQNWQSITGTFGLSAGKWYWEFESDGGGAFVGIADVEDDIVPQNVNGYFLGYGDNDSATTNSLGMYSANGVIYNDNSGATGSSYGSGNRVGVALDMDNEKIYFAVDNNWVNSADPAAGTGGATWNSSWSDTVFPAGSCAAGNSIFFGYGGFSGLGAGNTNHTNTDSNGYGAFLYSPPSGFYALCTKNLAEYG